MILHVLRDAADPHALPVIRAQRAQGTEVRVLLLNPGPAPALDAPVFGVGEDPPEGVASVGWPEAVELLFAADTVVTW